FGGALREHYQGHIVSDIVSQVDLVSTLAGFVGASDELFPYSRNMFVQKEHPSAFINSNRTIGLITRDQAISYDIQGKQLSYVREEGAANVDSLLHVVKAYYQNVFADFQRY